MTTALRNTGIEPVGEMPWGTHFCHFYETRDDLLETLLPFFKAGLEAGEFCAWVVSEPLTEAAVWQALDRAVPGLDRYVSDQSIEVLKARDVYLAGGEIDLHRIIGNWGAKLERAVSRGYPGIRVSGNTAWLEQKHWRDFMEYETELNRGIGDQPMLVLCTYPLTTCGATEFLDVAGTHQFAVAKRRGRWEVVETPQLTQAKTEIARLNRDLEQRVLERTMELEAAIAHVTRLTTLGELAASIAHEVNQPLAAIVADANASLNWLATSTPDLGRVRESLAGIVKDGHRAADVIQRIRQLATRTGPEKARLDVNDVIRDVVLLIGTEVRSHEVSLRIDLAAALPPVLADRIQLQQVLINFVINGMEAMASVDDRLRELVIRTQPHDDAHVVVAVQDAGVGIDSQKTDQLFSAFYTTKPDGMGMGLSISRSIIEAHGGWLWATRNPNHGATFHFALPKMP
jgi:C4-dicarboxylate-specific signal transduction histidine kinase